MHIYAYDILATKAMLHVIVSAFYRFRALVFLNFIGNFIKDRFSVATIAAKLANLSKTIENKINLNIKSDLLCFTFNVCCFITMLSREM